MTEIAATKARLYDITLWVIIKNRLISYSSHRMDTTHYGHAFAVVNNNFKEFGRSNRGLLKNTNLLGDFVMRRISCTEVFHEPQVAMCFVEAIMECSQYDTACIKFLPLHFVFLTV